MNRYCPCGELGTVRVRVYWKNGPRDYRYCPEHVPTMDGVEVIDIEDAH